MPIPDPVFAFNVGDVVRIREHRNARGNIVRGRHVRAEEVSPGVWSQRLYYQIEGYASPFKEEDLAAVSSSTAVQIVSARDGAVVVEVNGRRRTLREGAVFDLAALTL